MDLKSDRTKENLITSSHNAKIKEILLLQEKHSAREKEKRFVVEGLREVVECVNNGFKIISVFYCPSIIDEHLLAPIISYTEKSIFFEITDSLYNRIAYRGSTEGIIALVESKTISIESLELTKDEPFIIVAEGIEKPGNIGAILRTADACGADAILLCDCMTDLYNPNLIRASLGGVFSQKIVCCSSKSAIKWLKEKKIAIYTAQLQDSSLYYDVDMKRACAIVVGNEANGLTQQWRDASDKKILIPMMGRLDSLNVSVSTAILSYEALRQRHQKSK